MNTQIRKSYTELNKIYFWIATINNWLPLLESEENKKVIISSLKKLSDDKLISAYAFIIMPNHIHLIWSQDGMNGKETPKGSLLKYTAHIFLRYLKTIGKSKQYEVAALNKSHEYGKGTPIPWFVSHETLFHYIYFVNTQIRKSYTELNKIYFWIATINNWLPLLESEENKKVIISSLKKLSDDKLISAYAFIIMPNHIHLIWSQDGMNGKETPKGSLLKYTAHIFLRYLKTIGKSKQYEVAALNKSHEYGKGTLWE